MQTPEYTWPSRVGSPLSPALQHQASADSIGNEASSPPSKKSPCEVTLLDLTGCKKSTGLSSSSSLNLSAVNQFDGAGERSHSAHSTLSAAATEENTQQVAAQTDESTAPVAMLTDIPLAAAINHKQGVMKEDGVQSYPESTASASSLPPPVPHSLSVATSVATENTASYTLPYPDTSKLIHTEEKFDTQTNLGTTEHHTVFDDDRKLSGAEILCSSIAPDSSKPVMKQLGHEDGSTTVRSDGLDGGPSQTSLTGTTPTSGPQVGHQQLKEQEMEEDPPATPEKRKKKKPRCLYDERQMIKAVQMVEAGSSIMAAARHFNIPRATLWCRMKRDYPCAKLQTGPPSALLDEEEEAVCQWVAAMTAIGKPQTFKSLALIVKEVLDSAGRRNVFNNNKPSEGWIGKFKRKHMQLFSKKPEATTLRDNITSDDINKFFYELDYHLQGEGLCPETFLSPAFAHRVFNLDEAGVYIPNDDCLSKLLMRRSERCNLQGCGDSRQMVTAVSCGNAAGLYIRPLLLFKEPRIPFKTGCPGVDNSSFNVGISELGWMDHKAFLYWLQHFEDQLTEVSVEKPVLLLLDGHSPHISVTALEYAKECGVILHQIPPHTSHLLQPIYLALYKDLKRAYREVVIENWPKDDRVMNKKQFPAIFMEAWKRTTNAANLVDGYREAGIIPRDAARVTNKLAKEGDGVMSSSAASSTTKSRQLHSPTQHVKSSSLSSSSGKLLSASQQTCLSEQPRVSSTPSISLSSLQALLSSKVEEVSTGTMPPSSTSSQGNASSSYQHLPPSLVDSSEFIQGLQDAIDVVKEYIPKQVSDIYEKWIEEQNTTCTSDTLYHIWLCLHNKIPHHIPAMSSRKAGEGEDGSKCLDGATFCLPDESRGLGDTRNNSEGQESIVKCSEYSTKTCTDAYGNNSSMVNTSTVVQKQVLLPHNNTNESNASRCLSNSNGAGSNNINSTNFNGIPPCRLPVSSTSFSGAMTGTVSQYLASTPALTTVTTPSNNMSSYLSNTQSRPPGGAEYLMRSNCSVGDTSSTQQQQLQHHSQVQQHNFGFATSGLPTSTSTLQCVDAEYNRNMNIAHSNMVPMSTDPRGMAPMNTGPLRGMAPIINSPPIPRPMGTMDSSVPDRHTIAMSHGPPRSMSDLANNVPSGMTASTDCFSNGHLYREAGKHPLEGEANYQPQDKRYRM